MKTIIFKISIWALIILGGVLCQNMAGPIVEVEYRPKESFKRVAGDVDGMHEEENKNEEVVKLEGGNLKIERCI